MRQTPISNTRLGLGILCAVALVINASSAVAFDPTTANSLGDGVVNKVNVDTDAGKVITNFEYEVSLGNPINLSDGNVLLSGSIKESWDESNCNSTRSKAILVKLSPKGRLVTSFANGGVFTYERLDREYFTQAVEDNLGNIYVNGHSTDYDLADLDLSDGCDIQNSNPIVLKMNSQGVLDSGFGFGGLVTSIPGINNVNAIALSGDKLLISSQSYPQSFLLALNKNNGRLEESFGDEGNGKVIFNRSEISQISQILVEDKIYLFGDKNVWGDPVSECRGDQAALNWAIKAVTLNGKPVPSFSSGPCGTSFSNGYKEGAYGKAFYRDGNIYVIDGILKTLSGPNVDRYDTKLLKIDGSGKVDNNYSKLLDASLIAQPFSLTRTSYAVQSRTMDKDGRLLVSYNYNSGENAIVRIDENGLPDPDFGYQGKLQLGAVPGLLFLEDGTLFAFVSYSSNPTSSLYVYNIETLRAKRKPIWSDYQRFNDGFAVSLSNYSKEYTYRLSLEGPGKLQFDKGQIVVTNLRADGQESTLRVVTSRLGFRTDSSIFKGRSSSRPTIRIDDLPLLKLDAKQLSCSHSGIAIKSIDGIEVPLIGDTRLELAILDDKRNEVAISSTNQTFIAIDLSKLEIGKYYFCSIKLTDLSGLKGSTDSLQSTLAKEIKSIYDTEVFSLERNFLEKKTQLQKASVLDLTRARDLWRLAVERSYVKAKEDKLKLQNLRSLGKIGPSEYTNSLKLLNSVHRLEITTSTEKYTQDKIRISKNLELALEQLNKETSLKKSELEIRYWSYLAEKKLVVSR
jgi:hypothetical protein